ncbi:MAG: putative Zn-dependent protease [Granulosicoccus sp.]|jgi:predicted Zn-dependent protease
MRKKTFTSTSFILFSFLMIGLMSSCRSDPKDDIVVGQSKEEFDEADQIMIGNAISEIINESSNGFNVLKEEDYQEVYIYLNTLIDQIANTVYVQNRLEFDWKISILENDEEVDAFILPGGHLYIYSGLLNFLEGEHELVGMMAHEMAYVDSDDLMNQLKNKFGSKNLSKVISADPESHVILLDIVDAMGQMVFDETMVKEADQFCTDIICEFEWDGGGLLSLVKRGGGDPLKTIKWFQSRPVTNDRIDNLTDLIYNRVETCGTSDLTYYQRYLDKVIKRLP